MKLIAGKKSNPLAPKTSKKEVTILPQSYLETDIYKASREVKKMQRLSSNILCTWPEISVKMAQLEDKKKR